ncbi:MAG: hypothetical protein E6Z15_16840 [Paenibacillus macerans]|nr:hypothetical protein [Paenibacillus macerans]
MKRLMRVVTKDSLSSHEFAVERGFFPPEIDVIGVEVPTFDTHLLTRIHRPFLFDKGVKIPEQGALFVAETSGDKIVSWSDDFKIKVVPYFYRGTFTSLQLVKTLESFDIREAIFNESDVERGGEPFARFGYDKATLLSALNSLNRELEECGLEEMKSRTEIIFG